MIKDSKYVKINTVNPLYLTFNKMKRYYEEIDRNKYLTLVATNESKEKIKKTMKTIWNNIRALIMSITQNSDNYDEKYI